MAWCRRRRRRPLTHVHVLLGRQDRVVYTDHVQTIKMIRGQLLARQLNVRRYLWRKKSKWKRSNGKKGTRKGKGQERGKKRKARQQKAAAPKKRQRRPRRRRRPRRKPRTIDTKSRRCPFCRSSSTLCPSMLYVGNMSMSSRRLWKLDKYLG